MRTYNWFIPFWVLFIHFNAFGFQESAQVRPTGLLCSDEKYEALSPLPTYSGAKYNEIPLRVNLKKHCPVAGDQGNTGSCVGWAVGYGALTITRAIKEGSTQTSVITKEANSAAFIYNQVRLEQGSCEEGAYIEDAFRLVKEKGDCLEQTFNFEQFDCQDAPHEKAVAEADRFRIKDFATVFGLDDGAKGKIAKACKVLATQTPMVVGLEIPQSFWDILPGTKLWDPKVGEPKTGNHAMVLIGYDNIEKYFILMNSFGPAWGDNGFIHIRYDDFERLCRYAYVLILDDESALLSAQNNSKPTKNPTIRLSGEFVFRKPAGYLTLPEGKQTPFFEEVPVLLEESSAYYKTIQPSFEIGDVFQLVVRQIPSGQYAYVFSRDPEKKINFHFPKKSGSGRTADFIISQQAEIVIPGDETVLQIAHPGTDHLCIIYSSRKIPDLESRIGLLAEVEDEFFVEKTRAVFSDLLIPAEESRFLPNKMAFEAQTDSGGQYYAILIVLEVQANSQ